MFLYWKKRGAYELETLPADLAELENAPVERFSWSSTLDITRDLEDERAAAEERALQCQNPSCTDKRRAAKIWLAFEEPEQTAFVKYRLMSTHDEYV